MVQVCGKREAAEREAMSDADLGSGLRSSKKSKFLSQVFPLLLGRVLRSRPAMHNESLNMEL